MQERVWRVPRSFVVRACMVLCGAALFWCVVFLGKHASAASYLTRVSDLLSMSAPATTTNQTITFTLAQAIPANGAIDLFFNEGGFSIPAALNYTDVDVGFSAVAGGPYTERPLSSVQTAGTDRVVVTSGTTSARIHIDLNTTVGIAAGSEVQVKVGTNAVFGAIGDQRMTLSSATGTYPVTITTYDTSDAELDYGRTRIAVVQQVTLGPVDTTDQTPPVILSAAPTGLLQVGTRGVELFITTDENASCRYATSSMAYMLMPYAFSGTSSLSTMWSWHFAQVTGLEDDTTYTYFIRCQDYRLNEIDPDYELTFTIGIMPGSATSTATSTGTGTGTGTTTATSSATSTSGSGTGTGSGSGGGPSGSGSGNGPNGGDGSGNGGGGSGESGQGTKLPQADVRVDGYAYPGATVSVLRDGVVVGTLGAGGGGEFSHTTQGLDRGTYSYGVYAVDTRGVRSATFATTLWLRASTLNTLSNIMLPPTLAVAERSVQPGATIAVSGYSAPYASVTTWLRPRLAEVSMGDVVATTSAGATGLWALTLPTDGMAQGTYELVAQGTMQGGLIESDKSVRTTIGIGVSVAPSDCISRGDLNCDGSVNLVDFSILLFNWNTTNAVADINADGTVSLPDFSILLYYWTG